MHQDSFCYNPRMGREAHGIVQLGRQPIPRSTPEGPRVPARRVIGSFTSTQLLELRAKFLAQMDGEKRIDLAPHATVDEKRRRRYDLAASVLRDMYNRDMGIDLVSEALVWEKGNGLRELEYRSTNEDSLPSFIVPLYY